MTYKVSCRYWSEEFDKLDEAVEACLNERERSLSEDFGGDYYKYADDATSGAELCKVTRDEEVWLDVCDFEKID